MCDGAGAIAEMRKWSTRVGKSSVKWNRSVHIFAKW